MKGFISDTKLFFYNNDQIELKFNDYKLFLHHELIYLRSNNPINNNGIPGYNYHLRTCSLWEN